MRQTQIFSGSSHPALTEAICQRLGQKPAEAFLGKFSNGETRVEIKTSIRDQDVFIVQSGSGHINDHVIEMLIMISACKGGSSDKITAVMPYFPYSRQSKKKTHRGAITARMVANLMNVAGVDHVITIDLHASQMQGFFKCPVDNLIAEPLLARWIKQNIENWKEAVIVSKNPGGTKRVTSLADALKLSFGIVATDRHKPRNPYANSMAGSVIMEAIGVDPTLGGRLDADEDMDREMVFETLPQPDERSQAHSDGQHRHMPRPGSSRNRNVSINTIPTSPAVPQRFANGTISGTNSRYSPRSHPMHTSSPTIPAANLSRVQTAPSASNSPLDPDGDETYNDQRARDVTTGRFIQGHIVDDMDGAASPAMSAISNGNNDPMMQSMYSTTSSYHRHGDDSAGLGGTGDAAHSDEEEEEDLKNPELETTVTLVGNVRDRPVVIMDDMIDKAGSWVAAAETVRKRGGATGVICMATHGIFDDSSLRELEECDCIEQIVVTNTFPLSEEKRNMSSKLRVIDVSTLLAEAIRRNHHGESISQLFQYFD